MILKFICRVLINLGRIHDFYHKHKLLENTTDNHNIHLSRSCFHSWILWITRTSIESKFTLHWILSVSCADLGLSDVAITSLISFCVSVRMLGRNQFTALDMFCLLPVMLLTQALPWQWLTHEELYVTECKVIVCIGNGNAESHAGCV